MTESPKLWNVHSTDNWYVKTNTLNEDWPLFIKYFKDLLPSASDLNIEHTYNYYGYSSKSGLWASDALTLIAGSLRLSLGTAAKLLFDYISYEPENNTAITKPWEPVNGELIRIGDSKQDAVFIAFDGNRVVYRWADTSMEYDINPYDWQSRNDIKQLPPPKRVLTKAEIAAQFNLSIDDFDITD